MSPHALKMSDHIIAVFASQVFDVERLSDGSARVWFRGIDVTSLLSRDELIGFEDLLNDKLGEAES